MGETNTQAGCWGKGEETQVWGSGRRALERTGFSPSGPAWSPPPLPPCKVRTPQGALNASSMNASRPLFHCFLKLDLIWLQKRSQPHSCTTHTHTHTHTHVFKGKVLSCDGTVLSEKNLSSPNSCEKFITRETRLLPIHPLLPATPSFQAQDSLLAGLWQGQRQILGAGLMRV